jgi:hypothetical protein
LGKKVEPYRIYIFSFWLLPLFSTLAFFFFFFFI